MFTSDTLTGGEKKSELIGGSQQVNAGAEVGCQHSDPQSAQFLTWLGLPVNTCLSQPASVLSTCHIVVVCT